MKVLVSAYACEPDKGSEPGVGWYWASQLSRFHEVWVITRSNNQHSIERELATHPNQNIHFNYMEVPKIFSFWKRGQRGIYIYYCLWQLLAFHKARKLHKRQFFDAVHHITFGTVWLPTFMQFLNIPFVWGPIGGAESVPTILQSQLDFKWRFYEGLRHFLVKCTYLCNPIAWSAMHKASFILARTKITRDAFPPDIRRKVKLMIETGVNSTFLNEMSRENKNIQPPFILMVGRLLHWKGFDLGIEAFSTISRRFPNTHAIIVGTGPEEKRLKLLVERLNVANRITFTGQLPRKEVLRLMQQARVFLMPSMKDAGAWVLYEAMASGLPIVCLDYAGPAEIVDSSCAIAIPISKRDIVIKRMSDALSNILGSDSLADAMGKASIRRLKDDFLWEKKGNMIAEIYQRLTLDQDPT